MAEDMSCSRMKDWQVESKGRPVGVKQPVNAVCQQVKPARTRQLSYHGVVEAQLKSPEYQSVKPAREEALRGRAPRKSDSGIVKSTTRTIQRMHRPSSVEGTARLAVIKRIIPRKPSSQKARLIPAKLEITLEELFAGEKRQCSGVSAKRKER